MFFATVLWLLSVCQTVTGEPHGILSPGFNHVLEGTSATFTCNVTGRNVSNEELAWRAVYEGSLAWKYSGTTIASFYIHDVTIIDDLNGLRFGHYSVSYAKTVDDLEVSQLCITNVTKNDGLFLFYCIYISKSTRGTIGNASKLVVWTTQNSKPQCSFHDEIHDVISEQEKYQLNLTCSLEGGDPPPYLTWHIDDPYGFQIAGPGARVLSTAPYINSSDLGRKYFCRAEIKATP